MKINGYKIRVAQKFLNSLKKELMKIKMKESLTLESYSNGREQGYHLSLILDLGVGNGVTRWGCSFSENRNSDQLVVYVGLGLTAFQMGGNIPEEEAYRSARYFKTDQLGLEDALSYVSRRLRETLHQHGVQYSYPINVLK